MKLIRRITAVGLYLSLCHRHRSQAQGGENVRSRGSVGSVTAWRRAACLLLLAGGLPGAGALAQVPVDVRPAPSGFDLNVGLGMRLTSNAGLEPGAGSEGDSIADLRADLTGHRGSPRTDWSAKYTPFYTRYGNNGQFDTVNHALTADARYALTQRSKLTLSDRFYASRDLSHIDGADTTGDPVILTRLTRRWRNFADAGFDANLSRDLSLQVGASSRIERFDLSPSVNSNMDAARLGLRKQVGREDGFSTTYTYSRFGFENRGVDGAEAHGMDLAWTHGVPSRTDWVLSAGMSTVSRGSDRQNRFTAAASLHHPFRRVDFVSGYRRGLGADAGVANVTVTQDLNAGLSGSAGQRTRLAVRGEYGTRDSILDGGDRLRLAYAGGSLLGTVTVNQRLSISGEARRRKQTVTEGTGDQLTVNMFLLRLNILVF
jgi:hypothetical protein